MNMPATPPYASISHHPVFARFEPWRGVAAPGCVVNFVGASEREIFFNRPPTFDWPQVVETALPEFNEVYFEWIAVLEAVLAARDSFTMLELGAGYGRWLVNAAAALRRVGGPRPHLVGVEAEPEHFNWLRLHFADNGLAEEEHALLQAAAAGQDGKVQFYVGAASHWWGQEIYDPTRGHRRVESFNGEAVRLATVPAVSLRTLLQPLGMVDLIDLDVQGAELDVLAPAADALQRQVKRVHVGTHRAGIEASLRALFTDLGWESVFDYPCKTAAHPTPWGPIDFEDGVQTWLNPALTR